MLSIFSLKNIQILIIFFLIKRKVDKEFYLINL